MVRRDRMEYTRMLADTCANVSIAKLPPKVIHKAKLCVLDFIANIYGSSMLDPLRSIAGYIHSLGKPERATALGWGFSTGVQDAAFLNGIAAEAIEAQDGLRFGGNHPGVAVIPATLAVAEDIGLGGKDVIEGIIAGYEAANRVAQAMHPGHTLSGFLPTGTCGTFGAAAAVSKLKGMGTEGMLNTLGIAGYILPISMAEQLMGGYTVKIVQGGQAAKVGITASDLAALGITGEPYVLEGSSLNGGFTQITTKMETKLDKIHEELGKQFSIMDVYFKPYTACRHTHGAIQAILEILDNKSFEIEEIEKIDVFTYGIALIAVGKGISEKDTFVSAQFSIPYCVSACLLDGELGPRQLHKNRITDPSILDLSKKVKVSMDEELNSMYPDFTATRVEIHLKGGRKLERQVDTPKGDPRDPMDEKDISDKVVSFSGSRDRRKVADVINMVMDLENIGNIRDLIEII